jgi:hypothetical protein
VVVWCGGGGDGGGGDVCGGGGVDGDDGGGGGGDDYNCNDKDCDYEDDYDDNDMIFVRS